MMKGKDYTTSFTVDETPEQVFKAVTDPRGWWSEQIEGGTDKLNAEFGYRYKDVHRCRIRLTELVPGKKVVWHVLDNYFSFIEDQAEWKGTDMVFDISRKGDKTELHFTHVGLVPDYECFDICSDAWGTYIKGSLRTLIVTGKGAPNPKG